MELPLREQPVAWARLRVDFNCGLRRGAWYRVVQVAGNDAMLELTPEPVPVPRRWFARSSWGARRCREREPSLREEAAYGQNEAARGRRRAAARRHDLDARGRPATGSLRSLDLQRR